MADARDERAWASQDRKVERAGLADWERKNLHAQRDPDDPLADVLIGLGGSAKAATVLRQFMLFCLPPKSYGDSRRFKSGFYRMVAFAWRLAPELLDGCEYDKDVAAQLGLSTVAFFKHLEAVDRILSQGGTAVPEPGKSRVLPKTPRP